MMYVIYYNKYLSSTNSRNVSGQKLNICSFSFGFAPYISQGSQTYNFKHENAQFSLMNPRFLASLVFNYPKEYFD